MYITLTVEVEVTGVAGVGFEIERAVGADLGVAEERECQCIAIVASSLEVAQLRWFFVDPSARGNGLGKRLLNEAIDFARSCGYKSIMLWTVGALTVAAHLYRSVGFTKVEERADMQWGVEVTEERYELPLCPS